MEGSIRKICSDVTKITLCEQDSIWPRPLAWHLAQATDSERIYKASFDGVNEKCHELLTPLMRYCRACPLQSATDRHLPDCRLYDPQDYGDEGARVELERTAPLQTDAFAARQTLWVCRDSYGEQSALFDEGVCRSAQFAGPDWPAHLFMVLSLRIATERMTFTPATIDRFSKRLGYLGGPAEAGTEAA